MKRSALIAAVVAAAALTGCTATTEPVTTTTPEPTEQPFVKPELTLSEAISACATEIDRVVYLDPMYSGAWNGDGFSIHYTTDYADAVIKNGDWYFTYYPDHEDIAPVTCHTEGTRPVSMTRVEYEAAMGDRTYPNYARVATT